MSELDFIQGTYFTAVVFPYYLFIITWFYACRSIIMSIWYTCQKEKEKLKHYCVADTCVTSVLLRLASFCHFKGPKSLIFKCELRRNLIE